MPISDIPYAPPAAQPHSTLSAFALDDELASPKQNAPTSSDGPGTNLTRTQCWRALFGAPRELFVVYVVKLLLSYAYFSTALVLTLWLSAELGLSDFHAGLVYGLCGLSATVLGLIGGVAVDRAGVRPALLVGTVLATAARVLLCAVPGTVSAGVALALLMPLADALGIPVLTIAVKRCTRAQNAGLGFSLFYVFQNVACLVAGIAVDAVRRSVGGEGGVVHLGERRISYHEVVFLTGAVATFACFFIVLLGLRHVEQGRGVRVEEHGHGRAGVVETVRKVLRQDSFWRFAKLAFILLGISMIYRHLDATLPKYMVRVFGPAVPYGTYYALEPLIVIFAVPLAGTFITCLPLYTVLIIGTFIAALSPFWLCIANEEQFVALFVITLSIGESIYSPRVYQYTMAVSSVGSEGVYSALGNAPLFAVNVVAGAMNGILLENFVPNREKIANGAKMQPKIMWAIIGATSLTSPLLLALFRKHVEEPEVAEPLEMDEMCLAQESDMNSP